MGVKSYFSGLYHSPRAPYDWPWYLRYPIAVVGMIASAAFGLWLASHSRPDETPWVAIFLGGFGAIWAMTLASEAIVLLIVLALLYGAWWALSLLIPDSWNRLHFSGWMWGLILYFIAGYFYERIAKLKDRMAMLEDEVRDMRARVDALSEMSLDLLRH